MRASADRLFAVEDNASVVRYVTWMLRGALEVTVATTLAQAKAELDRASFEAAIVDIGLPDGSGLDLVEELRGRCPEMPIAILSASLEPSLINRAQLLNCTYVCKPDFGHNLRSFVRAVVSTRWTPDESTARALGYLANSNELSIRETQVVAMSLAGLSRRDIASGLGVSENTIKTQVRSILDKTERDTLSDVVWEVHNLVDGR